MTPITPKALAEFAHDVQVALPRTDVPEFDVLREVGMATTLAIHLRGLPEIPYTLLRMTSDHYFDIPSYALKSVLSILEEIEFVRVVRKGNEIDSVVPQIPYFESVYSLIGQYASTKKLTEHEQVTAAILGKLFESPHNKDKLRNELGADKDVFARCLTIGQAGSLIVEKRARGRDIVISPFYFADNLQGLSDVAAAGNASDIARVVQLIKSHQGWPTKLIFERQEIAGHKLNADELQVVQVLSEELLLKPPALKGSSGESLNFIFTPRPGNSRLNATNRQIYERAMAIVVAVRKGQLLPDSYPIGSPRALLRALKNRGKLGKNSEAYKQYQKLVEMRVGQLIPVGCSQAEFHLLRNEENEQALDLAISLVTTGETENVDVNKDARTALQKDERYINHLIAATDLKKRESVKIEQETRSKVEQFMFGFIK